MPPPDATIPPYLVTILIGAVVCLAGAIAFLFRHYSSKQDASETSRRQSESEFAKERLAWALERQRWETQREEYELSVRLEYEAKHREVLERHIQITAGLHEAARTHEDLIRREYAQIQETVQAKASSSIDKVTAVMDKFYDRYVGPRSRPKG
jgi:hypothetical protein